MREWFIIQEGLERGYTIHPHKEKGGVFIVSDGSVGFEFKRIPGFLSWSSGDTDGTKNIDFSYKQHNVAIMEKYGLPTPKDYGVFEKAEDITDEFPHYPLVVKPTYGSLSRGVYTNLNSLDEVQKKAGAIGENIKVEQFVEGLHFRILVVDGLYIGCVERRPAQVVGDGKKTIQELVVLSNKDEIRGGTFETHTTNHVIEVNQSVIESLSRRGYTPCTVPEEGEIVPLGESITATSGADYVDHTDALNRGIREACERFAKATNLLVIGFDYISKDVTLPLSPTHGAFNEFNQTPYIDLVENCNIGEKHSASKPMWDYIEKNKKEIFTKEHSSF